MLSPSGFSAISWIIVIIHEGGPHIASGESIAPPTQHGSAQSVRERKAPESSGFGGDPAGALCGLVGGFRVQPGDFRCVAAVSTRATARRGSSVTGGRPGLLAPVDLDAA